MNDPSDYLLAQRAATILVYLGPEALPPVAAALTNQYAIRYVILDNIEVMGTNACPLIPQLVQLLRGKDTFCASSVAAALGKLKLEPDLAVPALTNCLQDAKPALRIAAAEALLNFTNPPDAARTTLLALLSDPDPSVRFEATNALRRTGISLTSPH
jgi:HEAT repeat protein